MPIPTFLTSNWDKLLGFSSSGVKKLKAFLSKDKNKIAELEAQACKKDAVIAELGTIIETLEHESRVMDNIPEGCEIIQNNVLLHKKTGVKYCWNCWNKLHGRERRVLYGNDYVVKCAVCGIATHLNEFPPDGSVPV